MIDWGDLRYALAVVRGGSALAAGKALGVNQTTVVRRLAQLEAGIGADLFEKRASGYVATALGLKVCAAAERIEAEVAALENDLAAQQRSMTGVVRLTTNEALANLLVGPCLANFQRTQPGVRVQLITDDRRLDIAKGEADVALRAGSRPEGGGIVARRLPSSGWAVYCSHGYAAERSAPRSPEAIDGHHYVGLEGFLAESQPMRWLKARTPRSEAIFHSNSLTNLTACLRNGMGVGILPCMLGDTEPDLIRCFPPIEELDSEMWLIVREDVRNAPHVRVFADLLAAHVTKEKRFLMGR